MSGISVCFMLPSSPAARAVSIKDQEDTCRRSGRGTVKKIASSAESVGDGRFWEGTEGVVEGNFKGVELAETVPLAPRCNGLPLVLFRKL